MTYLHGISVTEVPSSAVLATVATAVIGLVATAPLATADAFPLDKAVLVTDLDAAIAAAGATGTLKQALTAIRDHVRTPVVVVRVAPGADATATELAIIGTEDGAVKTGMHALLAAYSQLNVKPRILGAPGLETEAVTDQLCIIAQRLRGRVYAATVGESLEEVIEYRSHFTRRELTLIYPDFLAPIDVLGNTARSYASARALGLRALIDQTQGWHKTLSNVPVLNVTGTTADVSFDVQDADSDANMLNSAQIVTIVRLNGKLRFWGNKTCAAPDSDFTFESAVRTAQVLADTMGLGLSEYMDRPLVPSLARDIVEEINELFRKLKRDGKILGAVAWFDAAKNPADSLRAGKLVISYRYGFVPPLDGLFLQQEITDDYLADFADLVANG